MGKTEYEFIHTYSDEFGREVIKTTKKTSDDSWTAVTDEFIRFLHGSGFYFDDEDFAEYVFDQYGKRTELDMEDV